MKIGNCTRLMLILIVSILNCRSYGQVPQNRKLNLDFEKISSLDKSFPDGWRKWGPQTDYKICLDSGNVESGRRCLLISSKEDHAFGSLVTDISLSKLPGKFVKLEGYIRTANVEGFAGLVLRVDGGGKVLAFDNMRDKGLTGTNDWKKYSITLELKEGADTIRVAALLEGLGQAWFDSLGVFIDGKKVD